MDPKEIQRNLDAFEQDPRAMLAGIPEKRDRQGAVIKPPTAFSEEDRRTLDFVLAKDAVRRRFRGIIRGVSVSLEEVLPGRAAIEPADRPEDLVDTLRYTRPEDIDKAGLGSAVLPLAPWSGDYWPMYLGILGRRYADPEFPAAQEFDKNLAYITAHPAGPIVQAGNAAAIDLLAPAEKYDLLVGDAKGTLTDAMWSAGKAVLNQAGKVEIWMGVCEGWAAASYMLPRPSHAAVVLAADGKTQLRFYPDDIKALASLLWAKASTPMKFIGTRSDEKQPKTDENGRIIDPAAFDTNPGTFHLVTINQIGVGRRAFIMDTTYDYEVWNQPIFAYEYAYFNPQTMRVAPDLNAAKVLRAEFTKDRFSKYRSKDAAAMIGVLMRIGYVGETSPEQQKVDRPEHDKQILVDYVYDLELDAGGKIVGGEWYQNAHPDFLWTPLPGARAVSPADRIAMGQWDPAKAMPVSWQKAAVQASAAMLPIAKIVERLIVLANE